MDSLLLDLKYAVRSMLRAPLFTLTAVLILALGTGVASGMFGIVHHLLLKPYDIPQRDRVVMLTDRVVSRGEGRGPISPGRFIDLRHGATVFQHLEAYSLDDAVLQGRDGSERLIGARITPALFSMLGVPASAGRPFSAADAQPGAPAVAIVSQRFVRSHGDGEASVIGRTLRFDGTPTLIVGTLPVSGELPPGTDVWRPLTLMNPGTHEQRTLVGVGRLRAGVSLQAARLELASLGAEAARRFPSTDRDLAPELRTITQGIVDEISPMFEKVASAAVLLTLLVVAANLAGLQLARGAARRREWAVRAAIGASPARLARQSMVESLLLTAVGGLLGLWVAKLTVAAVLVSIPPTTTRFIAGWSGIGVDGTLVACAVGVCLLTGLVFGLAPAFHAGRAQAALALRGGGPGSLGAVHSKARTALVVSEVALSLALLVGAILMLDGFRRLGGTDLGFDPSGILTLRLALPDGRYPDLAARRAFHERALERIAALHGVTEVAMISRIPSSGSTSTLPIVAEGGTLNPERPLRASLRVVTPRALDVLRLPLVRGRQVLASDARDAPDVVVINEALAARAWPGRDPLRRHLTLADDTGAQRVLTVVGVAKNVKRNWFERDMAPMAYVPDAQWGARTMQLLVRAEQPLQLAEPVRRALTVLDPEAPTDRVSTLESYLAEQTSGVRVGAAVMSWLGIFALLLAAIGLHGLVAFQVAQRGPEFGVRMALGAQRQDILALVLREGWRLVAIGLAIGLPLAAAFGWAMTATLFGVVRPDPAALAGVFALLAVAAGVALVVPAWRASRLDPVDALRSE